MSKTKEARPRRLSGHAKQLARDVAAYADPRHRSEDGSYYKVPAGLLEDLRRALNGEGGKL